MLCNFGFPRDSGFPTLFSPLGRGKLESKEIFTLTTPKVAPFRFLPGKYGHYSVADTLEKFYIYEAHFYIYEAHFAAEKMKR